jgi:hypothetical protein
MSELEGETGVDLCTWAMDFRLKVQLESTLSCRTERTLEAASLG